MQQPLSVALYKALPTPTITCLLEVWLQGLQEKGLQSRSATASLLIKNYQCMQEEI